MHSRFTIPNQNDFQVYNVINCQHLMHKSESINRTDAYFQKASKHKSNFESQQPNNIVMMGNTISSHIFTFSFFERSNGVKGKH